LSGSATPKSSSLQYSHAQNTPPFAVRWRMIALVSMAWNRRPASDMMD